MIKSLVGILVLANTLLLPAQAGLGEPSVRWTKSEISVCFGNGESGKDLRLGYGLKTADLLDYSDDEKKTAKDILMANYQVNDVGVSLTGFQDCSEKPQSDIYLIKFSRFDLMGGWSSHIGEQGRGVYVNCEQQENCETTTIEKSLIHQQQHVAINFYPRERKTSDSDRLRLILLHEFGHSLGLRHEHLRPEIKSDPNCTPWLDELENEDRDISTTSYGPYNPNSVMSYCWIYTINANSGLHFSLAHGETAPLYLIDQTIYLWAKLPNGSEDFQIQPKLSLGDRQTLRCLYEHQKKDPDYCQKLSNPLTNLP